MTRERTFIGELLAIGACAGLFAFGLAHANTRGTVIRQRTRAFPVWNTRGASFALHAEGARMAVRSRDGAVGVETELAVVVDGRFYPLVLSRDGERDAPNTIRGTASLPLPGEPPSLVTVEMHGDVERDAVTLEVTAPPDFAHTLSLRAEVASDPQTVFVSGVGPISEQATVSGNAALVDIEPHPVGIASSRGLVTVDTVPEDSLRPGEPMRIAVTSPPASGGRPAELHFVVGESSSLVWRSLWGVAGVPVASVHGHVTGTSERAHVFGRDAEGKPQVWALATEAGTFAIDAPASVVEWYATVVPPRASGLAAFVPGTARDLVLDVAPSGDLRVRVIDADAHEPLTARLLFHGLDGSVDPNFGPDYRASGSGPVIDALRGDANVRLPSGRYRIAATKGIEWTVDAQDIDVVSGRAALVELALRHVVATPGVVACDLHVHARPSFDSRVSPEDRVLSLVAAGIDFAVPTEHNVVGDYGSAVTTLAFGREFLSVPGVEVTTYNPRLGHFGVFPFPPTSPVPPYQHTSLQAITRIARSDPHRYFQLNHPRLPGGIGYFDDIAFDPDTPKGPRSRIDFDGIEVYNGFDITQPARVDEVLRDYWALLDYGWRYTATGSSDSHRIQYHWAGYPRTMITVGDAKDEKDLPDDPRAIVESLKKGRATVTSGPIIDFVLAGAGPGDEVLTRSDTLHGHLLVRGAPWLDITQARVVVGEVGGGWRVVATFEVPSRPTRVGPEAGSLEQAQARTIRMDRDVDVPVGAGNGWVQVIAKGKRLMSDVLPFLPVAPLAFTNPVYVVRPHDENGVSASSSPGPRK